MTFTPIGAILGSMRTLKLTLTEEHWTHLHKLRTQIGASSLADTVRYFIQKDLHDFIRSHSETTGVKTHQAPTMVPQESTKPATPTKRWISDGVDLTDCRTGADIQAAVNKHKEKQAADRKNAALRKPAPNHPTYDDYVIECELEEDTGKLSYTEWQYCKENGVEGPTWACDAWEQASAHAAYALLSKRDGKPWVPYPLQTTLVKDAVG